MHFVRDMSFGRDMRYARLKLQGRIEYHAEPCEAYHFCGAKISRRAVRGISLLRSKNITPSEARHITFAEQNTLYLAGKACEKEYEQNCPYSFFFVRQFKICFMVGVFTGAFCLPRVRCATRQANPLARLRKAFKRSPSTRAQVKSCVPAHKYLLIYPDTCAIMKLI